MSDSHLPHCTICLKPLMSGERCKEHIDLEKFPLFDPEAFKLPDALQFFANSGMDVIVIDEKGAFKVKSSND